MKLKFGILALDIALYKRYDFYSGQIRTLTIDEDMEEGFAIDLCSKKVLESCAVTHSCLDFFSHVYTKKRVLSLAIKVLHICWWH